MTAHEIQQALTDITLKTSNFQEKRNYISLSNMAKEATMLLHEYRHGYRATTLDRLRCYKGYQMEADLVRRIKLVCHSAGDAPELSLHDGLFKGHPDLEIQGVPADCKSVLRDDWVPEKEWQLPGKVQFQMNAYMLASGTNTSFVIYESRQSGIIRVFEYKRDESIIASIEKKIDYIINQLNQCQS